MSKYRIRHSAEGSCIVYIPERKYMGIFWLPCEDIIYYDYASAELHINRLKVQDKIKDSFTYL